MITQAKMSTTIESSWENEHLKNELASRDAEVAELNKTILTMRDSVWELSKDREQLRDEIAELRAWNSELVKHQDKLADRCDELCEQVKLLQNTIEIWKDAHITKNVQCDQLREQLAKREKQNVMLRDRLFLLTDYAEESDRCKYGTLSTRLVLDIAQKALDATADLAGLILCDAEPVAWSTFDGEGGYNYRSYIDNEDYQDKYRKRNQSPTYLNWVEPLYKARKP